MRQIYFERIFHKLRHIALCAALFFVVSPDFAFSQALSSANTELKREHDVLFAQVLKSPSNVDLSFRYAEIATKLGDYEAAIGALERIIFYNPGLPRVRLELGLLYFRLGSYEMARSYFESAIASPDTPFEVKSRVAGFLSEIDRRLQTTQLSFFGQIGTRFQTNANAGPNTPNVKVLGFDAVLNNQFTRKKDWNLFATGSWRYVYDFENQRGDVMEAQLTTYYSRQNTLERLNTGLVEATVGPRLALAPDLFSGLSVKPYAIGGAVSLGDYPYMTSAGLGVTVAVPLVYVLLEPGYENRRRSFRNSHDITNATDQSGRAHVGYLNASGTILPQLRWLARISNYRVNAFQDFNAYTARSFDLALPYDFDAFSWSARKWTLAPFVGFTRTVYDQPNVIVDPTLRRRDKEWRVGANLDAAIWKYAGLGLLVQYSSVQSDIRNYEQRNFSVTFGPTGRF